MKVIEIWLIEFTNVVQLYSINQILAVHLLLTHFRYLPPNEVWWCAFTIDKGCWVCIRSTTPRRPFTVSCTGLLLAATVAAATVLIISACEGAASLEFSLTNCWRGEVTVAGPFVVVVGVGMLCMLFSLMLFWLFSSSTSVFKLSGTISWRLDEDRRVIRGFATSTGGGIMTSVGAFEDCEAHSITGVTWDVPAGGGLGSLFRVSGEVFCCTWAGAFDRKLAAPAAVCVNRSDELEY